LQRDSCADLNGIPDMLDVIEAQTLQIYDLNRLRPTMRQKRSAAEGVCCGISAR